MMHLHALEIMLLRTSRYIFAATTLMSARVQCGSCTLSNKTDMISM